MLEVVGVTGVVHLGQIQSGFRSALRIAQVRAAHSVILKQTTVLFGVYMWCYIFLQGGHIKIHLHSDIPVQVDGEPWVQSPGDVVVLKSALKVKNRCIAVYL
jgi:diacylglycerol kinase (ATP)